MNLKFWKKEKRNYNKIKTSEIRTICKMRKNGIKKTQIAKVLDIPYSRVNYIDSKY